MILGRKVRVRLNGENQVGEIRAVDNVTYSDAVYSILIIEGRDKGERIARFGIEVEEWV